MSNLTQEEIADALAAAIEAVSQASVVISDKKFSEAAADLLRLLASAAKNNPMTGWILSCDQIVSQDDDGTGEVAIVYGFNLSYIHEYLNDSPGDVTSEVEFKREIFRVNSALNIKRNLGLDNRVRHQCLVSTEPFGIAEAKGNSKLFHLADFTLDIQDINTYQEIY
ncbi:MAG TPA: hypothetical protein VF762_02360 [Blastocatellia bacterium]